MASIFLLWPQNYLEDIIKNTFGHHSLLSKTTIPRIQLVKVVVGFVIILGFILLLRFSQYSGNLVSFYTQIKKYFIQIYLSPFKQDNPHRRLFIFVFLAVVFLKIGLLFIYPLLIDENYVYMEYGKNNLLYTLFWYPKPSNHIFYTLIGNVLDSFIPHSLLAWRLPSFFALISVFMISFQWIQRNFTLHFALIISVLLTTLPGSLYIGSIARGYSFHLLFVLIQLIILYQWHVKKIVRTRYSGIYILLTFFGFLTVPSFLYPYLSFVIIDLILCNKNSSIIKCVKTHLIPLVPVILYYGFIISINGADKVFLSNHHTEYFSRIPTLLWYHIYDLLGLPYLFIPIVLGYIVWHCIQLKKRKNSFFSLCLLIYLAILYSVSFTQQMLVPSRVISYMIIPLVLSILTLQHVKVNFPKRSTYIMLVVVVLSSVYWTISTRWHRIKKYKTHHTIVMELINRHPLSNISSPDSYFNMVLLHHKKEMNSSIKFQPYKNTCSSCILVWPENAPPPSAYQQSRKKIINGVIIYYPKKN